MVSHDRHFLDEVSNKVWYAEDKGLVTYPGTYSEFHYHQTKREKDSSVTDNSVETGKSVEDVTEKQALDKREQAERRNRLYKELVELGIENMENWKQLSVKQLQAALRDLESKIHINEDKKAEFEKFIADPSNFNDKDRAEQLSHEYSELTQNLQRSYERWDEITAHLDLQASKHEAV